MFKIVVADVKTKRTYQKEVGYKESGLIGRKIGDKIKGDFLGLHGYELQLTGGSDKQGFPMRPDIHGSGRKKMLLVGRPGFHPTTEGERRRKLVRGNTYSEEVVQVNMKVLTYGKDSLAKLFGKEEPKEETKHEKKEEKHEEHKAEKREEHAEKKHEEKEEHKTEKKEEHAHEHKAEHAEHKEAKHEKPAEHKAEHTHEHKAEHAEHKGEHGE